MIDTQEKVTWIYFYWLCAAGLAVSLAHFSVFCGHITNPILRGPDYKY